MPQHYQVRTSGAYGERNTRHPEGGSVCGGLVGCVRPLGGRGGSMHTRARGRRVHTDFDVHRCRHAHAPSLMPIVARADMRTLSRPRTGRSVAQSAGAYVRNWAVRSAVHPCAFPSTWLGRMRRGVGCACVEQVRSEWVRLPCAPVARHVGAMLRSAVINHRYRITRPSPQHL